MRFAPLVLALVLALPLPAELSPANIAQTRQRWQWALPTQCMIEEVASASGSDPFPHRNYVRGYARPD